MTNRWFFSGWLVLVPVGLLAALFPGQLQAALRITELCAAPETGFLDEDGQTSDWIEIHNDAAEPMDLGGWYLTDRAGEPLQWSFPSMQIAGHGTLVVFASGKNRREPGQELHANFKLSADGEYLALTGPAGFPPSVFGPQFPAQPPGISYGLAFDGTSYGDSRRYFTVPTPGKLNPVGPGTSGPLLLEPDHAPRRPSQGADLVIRVKALPAPHAVAEVRAHWLAMYGNAANPLQEVILRDDGMNGDSTAGDATFSAVLPGSRIVEGAAVNSWGTGRLIRWYFTATDTSGAGSRWPLFASPAGSAEYLGTVSADAPTSATSMPVWYWFAANPVAAGTDAGTRGSAYYQEKLYDNILIRRRGGATSTNSRKFDFNTGDHCFINETVGSVEEANLNVSAQDSTLARPPMAFEMFRTAGHPACAAFPVLMRGATSPFLPASSGTTNTSTYFVEQVDERFLERHGLDPEGALYKMNQKSNLDPVFTDPVDGVEKRTREQESHADLGAVCTALRKRGTTALRLERTAFLFDHFDVANLVNYLAVRAVINDYDDVRKNFYVFRDTNDSGEWKLLPWDKDGTLGVTGDGGTWLPHPFFGDLAHLKQNANQWNLLWEAVFNDPGLREMYLRRLRTVMDQQLQPAAVPIMERYAEQRADAWGAAFSPVRNVSAIKTFLSQRRVQLYQTYGPGATLPANRLVPAAQGPEVRIAFGEVEAFPQGENPDSEYIELRNSEPVAVDVSGWRVSGGIEQILAPGTVIPAGGSLYLTHRAAAFRTRSASPRGGQSLQVQGGWSGNLSARGETLVLHAPGRPELTSIQTAAEPTPAQLGLRISKLMYAPPEDGIRPAGEYEFLEILSVASTELLLDGVRFTHGITYQFPAGARIHPGQRMILVKNAAAFADRYGQGVTPAGTWTGSLDNAGERIRLEDGDGEEILDFSYNPAWYPRTRRGGSALVIGDAAGDWKAWDTAGGWRESTTLHGSPGAVDPAPPPLPRVILVAPGTVRLEGQSRTQWILQRSEDLTRWENLTSIPLDDSGNAEFLDAANLLPRRWYRAARP